MNARAHEYETDESASTDALAALRRDEAPARDLWSGIQARISVSTGMAAVEAEAAPLVSLREEHRPPRDLWPQIENRMRAQRARRFRAPVTAAAALAASLVVMLGLQVMRGDDAPVAAAGHGGGAMVATAASAPHAPLHPSAEVLAAMRGSDVVDPALRQVSAQPLAKETRALVRANLKIVSSAEIQLKRALAADPDGEYLERLLETTRQQHRDLRVVLADKQ